MTAPQAHSLPATGAICMLRQPLRERHGSDIAEMMKSVITVETGKGVGTGFAVVIGMPALDGLEAAAFTVDRNNRNTRLN